jgi:integrase
MITVTPSCLCYFSTSFVKAWRRVRKEAGLEGQGVVFHTTRHTTLSMLANAKTDFEIAQIANHKDFRSTRRYTHADAEKVRENFTLIGDLIK